MASLRPPSAGAQRRNQRSPSPRLNDHDMLDGHNLPEGSTLFQEVMAELHPPPHPPSQAKSPATRRRKNTQVKHVHYLTPHDPAHRKEDWSSQEEGEEEAHGPEKQILHGKCHCYFVENGNVTGLADHQCHHEHRLHPSPHPSPSPSPRPTRKLNPGSSPEGSPPSRSGHYHHHHHHHHHHHSHHQHHFSLQLPEDESFRGRSNSDSASMRRGTIPKRTSLSPSSSATSNRGKTSPTSPRRSPVPGGSPGREKAPPVRRTSSLRHDEELSEGMASSLRISSPPPIRIQDTSDPGGASERAGRRVRKLSPSHPVDSEQLHYLYDQFLVPGSGGS